MSDRLVEKHHMLNNDISVRTYSLIGDKKGLMPDVGVETVSYGIMV